MKIFLFFSVSLTVASCASNMVFKKIEVEMGAVASDDDIRLKLCDKSKCCTTKVLSNLLSSEWVANKKETWDGSKLGNCSQILFDENLSTIEVALLKDGKRNGPEVKSMTLSGQLGSDKKKINKYKCGSYKLSATDTVKSNFCQKQSSTPSTTARSAAKPTPRPASPTSSSTMTFKRIDVQMGNVGSDDDMRVKICDSSKCCTTKKLSHLLSSEWVAKKKETWDGSDMGNCSGILFDQKLSSIEVAILKNGKKSAPEIKALNVTGQIGSNKKNLLVYKCREYKFSKTDSQKTSFCLSSNAPSRSSSPSSPSSRPSSPTSSVSSYSINEVVVFVGDDGTNEDVSLQICNERSSLNCCDTGVLDSSFSDDWSKNDKETWANKKLGACKTASFDACKGFDVAIKKAGGKDSLKVSNITLALKKPNENSSSAKFICPSYTVAASDTTKRNTCTLDRSSSGSLSCPSSPNSRPPTPPRKASPTAAPRPSVTSRPSSPCLRSGAGCDEETVTITSFEVEMGSDGTNDPVTAQICSETADVDVCCETPTLNKPGSNNWSRGKETWPLVTLGRCAGERFPTKARTTVTNLFESTLSLSLKKKGRDNAQIQEFFINTENESGVKRKFKCGRFSVNKEKVTKECYVQYPKPSGATTRKSSATTTRPPFRSGSG